MRTYLTLMLACLWVASAAWAAEPKTLYVKAHVANVLKEPKATATELGTVSFGDEVTWLGSAERPFHKVSATVMPSTVGGDTDKKRKPRKAGSDKPLKVEGYMLQQNLSSTKPEAALASSGSHNSSMQSLSTSGAATKAMSEAGLKYAERKGTMDQALRGVVSTEVIAVHVKEEDAMREIGCGVNGGCK